MGISNMRLKYRIPLAIIAIMIVITMFIGSSYALWSVTKTQKTTNALMTGCFELEFTEQSSSVNLTNTYPMEDTKGLQTPPYTFTIKNTCDISAEYNIYLNTLQPDGTKIPDNLVKYSLQKSGDATIVAKMLNTATENTETSNFTYDKTLLKSYALETGTSLARGVLAQNESVQYSLRLWIDETGSNDPNNPNYVNNYEFEGVIAAVAYATD